jgi:molecular chaperone GrpE (heat shock protein)
MFEVVNPSPNSPHDSDEAARTPATPLELEPFLPFAFASLSHSVAPGRAVGTNPAQETTEEAEEKTREMAEASAAALADWKDALRRDFEAWLASIEIIPDPAAAATGPGGHEAPDLYSFFEQLTIANTEARKNNRRTAEAFSQWGETLSKFDTDLRLLRELLARQCAANEEALPRPWCLALVEIVDRLHRLATAFSLPMPRTWWGRDAHWHKAWEAQRQGFDILLGHVEALLKQAGIARITTLHEPFDPATMAAVATATSGQWPPQTVLDEIAPGYRLRGDLLRVAQVKVATRQT